MKKLLLLILPIIFLSITLESKHQRGPYWFSSNMDPDYAYLLNSLNMSKLKVVGHVDHPGTTTQLFGAAVLTITKFVEGKSSDEIEVAVLKNPEKYLGIIVSFMLCIYALVILLCGKYILRATNSLFTALSFQFIPFLFPSIMWSFSFRLCAEPFLMIISQILCCYALVYSVRKNISEEKFAMQSSFLVASGVVTKIVFAPHFLMPLFLINKIKNKVKYLAWFLLGFFILVIPILTKFNNFTRFVREIFLHKGLYGLGDSGFISYQRAMHFLGQVYRDHILFMILPLLGLLVINKLNANSKKLMFGLLTSYILLFLSVIKHPDMHYLISGIPLLGTILILVLGAPIKRQKLFKIVFMIFAFMNLQTLGTYYYSEDKLTDKIQSEWELFEKLRITNYEKCATLTFGPYSPHKALMFGNHFATKRYSDILAKIYLSTYYLESESRVLDWDENSQSLHRLIGKYKCVAAVGPKDQVLGLNIKYVEIVKVGEYNGLYIFNEGKKK